MLSIKEKDRISSYLEIIYPTLNTASLMVSFLIVISSIVVYPISTIFSFMLIFLSFVYLGIVFLVRKTKKNKVNYMTIDGDPLDPIFLFYSIPKNIVQIEELVNFDAKSFLTKLAAQNKDMSLYMCFLSPYTFIKVRSKRFVLIDLALKLLDKITWERNETIRLEYNKLCVEKILNQFKEKLTKLVVSKKS